VNGINVISQPFIAMNDSGYQICCIWSRCKPCCRVLCDISNYMNKTCYSSILQAN